MRKQEIAPVTIEVEYNTLMTFLGRIRSIQVDCNIMQEKLEALLHPKSSFVHKLNMSLKNSLKKT